MVSTAAFAQVVDEPGSKTVITKSSPDGMTQKKVIIRRHGDDTSRVVIRRHDGYYGSSMPDRTVAHEPSMRYYRYYNGYGYNARHYNGYGY